ncbi:glycosyltransferase [bacterium]|nr:glycosyltransferase [bacterium]
MYKVLIISYSFPRLFLPESIQAARCIKSIEKFGWNPVVLTVSEKTTIERIDPTLSVLLDKKLRIARTRSIEYRFLISITERFFPILLFLPDSKIGWYPFACRRAIAILKKGRFDLIYSRACYFTSNLVALRAKKKTGIPWVAHFSDPWIDNPYNDYGKIDGYVNRRFEKLVIENADALVFVTEEARQLVMGKYPKPLLSKSHVIPHCYDTKLFSNLKKKRGSKITFSYTGNFYGERSPVSLFMAMKNIHKNHPDIFDDIIIQIIGRVNERYRDLVSKMDLGKAVTIIDNVTYLKSLEYMVNSDVLISIEAPSESPGVFLPSKIADYLGSGNPILGIIPKEGASSRIICQAGGIVVEPGDTKGIENSIISFYQRYKEKRLNTFRSEKTMEEYHVLNTTERLAELFNKAIA